MKYRVIFLLIFFFCLNHAVYAYEDRELYALAQKAAKAENIDFSFMHFRAILRDYPHSVYREKALLGLGEYFFLTGEYKKSAESFYKVLAEFPGSETKLFSLVHLLKMAKTQKKEAKAEKLTNEIVGLQRVSFVFRDFKEYTFLSPLRRNLVAHFYIDKIKFYIEEKPFEKIAY